MAYDLSVHCSHRTDVLSVPSHMSMEEIMELIGSHFGIPVDSFELQVYDGPSRKYIDFDDEYAEELRQRLPTTYRETLKAEVLFKGAEETEIVSITNDTPSPLDLPANSPSGMSVSEDFRSTTPDIDLNLRAHDNSLSSLNDDLFHFNDDTDSIYHVTFSRDVAPYQRSQYQINDYSRNATHTFSRKKNYTIRIEGAKTPSDEKYASILPEIKVPSRFLRQDQLTLVVAIVIEERNEKQVSWRLDTNKGFLHDDAQTDKIQFNPLCLNIDRSALTDDGIFKLPLRMCTISGNQIGKAGLIFNTLCLSAAEKLHSAAFIPNTPRLACVIADESNNILSETFGLSDFMRPKSYGKRKVEEMNSAIINCDERTETQLEIPNISKSVSMTPIHVTTSNLHRKHIRLMKEFTIAVLGSNCAQNHDLISEIDQIDNHVVIFDQPDPFIYFLNHTQDQQVVLILPNCIEEAIIPLIHNIPLVDSIYVLGTHNDKSEEWPKKWKKVIGIFNDIRTLYQELKQIIQENISGLIPISTTSVSANTDLNTSSVSFIYYQILAEILLQIQCNEKIKQDFIRRGFTVNDPISFVVDEFKHDYNCSSYIWWYMKESFVYSLLNKALKEKDIDTIAKIRHIMRDIHNRYNRLQFLDTNNAVLNEGTIEPADGFSNHFVQKAKRHHTTSDKLAVETGSIYDFYRQIGELHLETDQTTQMILYRGQGLSSSAFEKLNQNRGGLLSFNSFLSMSTDRDVSYMFAESARSLPDLTGILFQISINMSASFKPFVSVNDNSCFFSEEEILFSMHSVFRIGETKYIDDRLWQVNLTFTDDCDKRLKYQFERYRQKMSNGSTRLHKLCLFMIDMGEFEKAEEICNVLPETEFHNNQEELAYLYNQLGNIMNAENDFSCALAYYRRALKIRNNNLSYDRPELARLLSSIGMVYKSIGNDSKGISYLRKALDIQQSFQVFMHHDVIMTFSNIGQLYSSRGEYTTSLSYFQKAIEIQQNFHVSPYPFLASIYMNIGQVYYLIGDSPVALIFLQKTLEIYQQKSLFIPTELVEIYNTIGVVCISIGNYTDALENYQKAIQIQETYLAFAHLDIAKTYDSIGHLYNVMGNNSTTSLCSKDTYEIRQKFYSPCRSYAADSYNSSENANRFKKYGWHVSSNYREVITLDPGSILSHHLEAATTATSIDLMRKKIKNHSKTLCHCVKAVESYRKNNWLNECDLMVSSKSNHGLCPRKNYLNLPDYHEIKMKPLCNILRTKLSSELSFYDVIAPMSEKTYKYYQALYFFEKALELRLKVLPPNHSLVAVCYANIGSVYDNMGKYSQALSHYENALEICEKTLPLNYGSLATSYNDIAGVYKNMGEYSKALSFYEKALGIFDKTLPLNHGSLATSYNNIGEVYSNMGEYSRALSLHEKALEIWQKTLPSNHPNLTTSYNNIGGVYDNMGEYSKALSRHEKALEIWQNTLPLNHPDFANSYYNSGGIRQYGRVLESTFMARKSYLEIQEKTLSPNHPSLATSCNNAGLVYKNMGKYSKAFSFYEKAPEIWQKALPLNRLGLATFYTLA